MKAAVFT